MKKLLIPVLYFAFFSCNQTVEKKQTVTKDSAGTLTALDTRQKEISKNPVELIKEQVKQINTGNLAQKHYEFTCDELTKVDYYYLNGELVKITVDFGTVGDAYAKEDYYYTEGKLIFKYEFVEGGPACEGCITTNEYRSYVHHNKVIKYLKNKDVAACRKCEFSTNSKELRLLKASDLESIKAVLCR